MATFKDAMRAKKKGEVEKFLEGLTTGVKIDGKKVNWTPPRDLEPFVAEAIKNSIKALEAKIKKGEANIASDGEVSHG